MDGFSYDSFDRQMDALIAMTQALKEGFEDISTMEMNLDIKSLCIKASRLCAMADTDFALQQQDLARLRTARNKELSASMNALMRDVTTPMMVNASKEVRANHKLEGHKSVMFPCQMAQVLPRLSQLLNEYEPDDSDTDNFDALIESTSYIEKKHGKIFRHTQFPGMDFRERYWMLYELFALQGYLLLHFRRVVRLCDNDIPVEYAGNRLREVVRMYGMAAEGSAELDRYWQALHFDNPDGLTIPILQEEKKNLRREVPHNLQLCFMTHIDDLDSMAQELVGLNVNKEDYLALVDVLSKWQMVEQEIMMIQHPEEADTDLYNEIFVTVLNGKRVDMVQLRQRIQTMVSLVTQKNHWFCLWSVLWHKGYLKDKSYSAFARQMMHDDWFRSTSKHLHFSSDTLSEYTGYFTERQYPVWRHEDYLNYRDTHNKKKWGTSLCKTFSELCFTMESAFDL